jgi:hypothetical protein
MNGEKHNRSHLTTYGKTVLARWNFEGLHIWHKPSLSGYLVCLVHLVNLIQPNKPDRPNRPNEQDRLVDFFSILLTQRRVNPVAHIVRDRNYADANN